MVFGFNRKTIGLEISEEVIRIVLITKDEYGWVLLKAHEVKLPKDILKISYRHNNVVDKNQFKSILEKALSHVNGKTTYLGLSLPNAITKVFIQKYLELPQTREKIEQMILWGAKRDIQFPKEKVKIAFDTIGENQSEEKYLLVLFAIHDVIQEYESLFKDLKIQAKVIRPSGLNHLNFYTPSIPGTGMNAFLGIFENYFFVFVFENKQMIFCNSAKRDLFDIHFFQDIDMAKMLFNKLSPDKEIENVYFASQVGYDLDIEKELKQIFRCNVLKLEDSKLIRNEMGIDISGTQEALIAKYGSAIGAAQSIY